MKMTYTNLEHGQSSVLKNWTFPAFRHLLDVVPTKLYPRINDPREILPVGSVAQFKGQAIGLVLGCLPLNELPDNIPELLSIFVEPEHRRRGVGRELVRRFEAIVSGQGFSIVTATYNTASRDTYRCLEHLFSDLRWAGPQVRLRVFHFALAEVLSFFWFDRYSLRKGLEIFRWTDLGPRDLESLKRSHEESGWIDDDLLPWYCRMEQLDPTCSLGVRDSNQIVGWVLGNRHDDTSIRYTNAFIRADLARRAQLLPLWTESLRVANSKGYQRLMFTVADERKPMAQFIDRWCEPALKDYESRWVWKRFSGGKRFVRLKPPSDLSCKEYLPNSSVEVRQSVSDCSTTGA